MKLSHKTLIVVLLILGVALGNVFIEQDKERLFPKQSKAFSATQVFLEFIGEFRYTLASYLWIKSDLWFHEIEEHQDWKKERDLLPLFKAITILDPHFVEAYDLAGYQLGVNLKEYRIAEEFLREGLRNNPKDLTLLLDLTQLLFLQKRYEDALPFAQQSVAAAFSPTHKFRSPAEAWDNRFNSAFYLSHIDLVLHRWDEMERACDLRISLKAAVNVVPYIMKMNVPNWRYLLTP